MTNISDFKLELYWNDIPTDYKKAITYPELVDLWDCNERYVRLILQKLSLFDNGDNYILVRSGSNKGFYKTDDINRIHTYKIECLNKGRSVLAPLKKINRVLNTNTTQYAMRNNLKVVREALGLKQIEVCEKLKQYDSILDKSMLSKMENDICLPTPYQLEQIAKIYGCSAKELVDIEIIG